MLQNLVLLPKCRAKTFAVEPMGVSLVFMLLVFVTCVCTPQRVHAQDKSPQSLLERAQKGDAQAQFDIGVAYLYGRGVSKRPSKAFTWFRKAADQGHASAQYAVGRMYYYGLGVEPDANAAIRCFRQAAEKDDAEAQFALGVMYQFGKSVETDLKEAARWYRAAAGSGLASAQYGLGTMYSLGQGVVKDAEEGIRWLRKAAEQNYRPASQTLVIIETGGPEIEVRIQQIQVALSMAF